MSRFLSPLPLVAFLHLLATPPPVAPAQQDVETFSGTIKYLGGLGFPDMKGRQTWENTMVVTRDSVEMIFHDPTISAVSFAVANVTAIRYGQAATRHVGTWVAVGLLVAPIALLGMLHKTRHHFVTINYTVGGEQHAVYLEANKDIFPNLLNTLSYHSKRPIWADEKEKEWLMTQGVVAHRELEPVSADTAATPRAR